METAEVLKKVRKIEIKTRGLSNNLFSGEYHSAFKGRGMSFAEVREYQYGDDVRNIDWNVTARFSSPYVKVFEEERELTMMLLIDISESDFFGTGKQTKNETMAEIAAILSFSAITNNDKVGVIFFSDQVEQFIPPKKGKRHILRIIRELIDFKPQRQQTNIGEALRYLNNMMKKRTIAFLMSDFIDHNYQNPVTIASRRHDLAGIHLHDPRETELPNIGLVRLTDAETGQTRSIDTSRKKVRQQYKEWYQVKKQYAKNTFLKSGADWVDIDTTHPYVNTLLNFFKRREKRH